MARAFFAFNPDFRFEDIGRRTIWFIRKGRGCIRMLIWAGKPGILIAIGCMNDAPIGSRIGSGTREDKPWLRKTGLWTGEVF
jgi:hypothetical protein